MPGINRSFEKYTARGVSPEARTGPCVFVSHKREDLSAAVAITKVLESLQVDFWLDLEQLQGGEPATSSEHHALTEAIEAGIANSTHLLAVVTPRTRASWWVPFEIGSCRTLKRAVAFFIHRDVAPEDYPSYFWCGTWLYDQESFYAWARNLSAAPQMVDNWWRLHQISDAPLDPFLVKSKSPPSRGA